MSECIIHNRLKTAVTMLQAVTGPISLVSVYIACIKFVVQRSRTADILYSVSETLLLCFTKKL